MLWFEQNLTDTIRIPYFIQLTTDAFNYYFKEIIKVLKIKVNITQNYAHGFIDKMALLPCDFNEIGVIKFIESMKYTTASVYEDIVKSLKEKNKNDLFRYSFLQRYIESE